MSKRLLALTVSAVLFCSVVAIGASLGKVARAAAPPATAPYTATDGSVSVPSAETQKAAPSEETETESKEDEAKEKGAENTEDGGHADPEGVDVDHQFEGPE